ncbi:MAG: RNA polymerase sigma factor, partial [Alistipes sp.]|nr:RNA polymerase sigma factor [Alistipes sp.]
MTDKELITRIVLHNDTEAFSVVMQRYSGLVFSTALSIVKDYALAEEVMQLSLIKAYKNLHHWRSGTSLAPYLRMITHNQAIDTLKSRQKERHSDISTVSVADEDSEEHYQLLEAMDRAIAR